jgi:hypothetical protein
MKKYLIVCFIFLIKIGVSSQAFSQKTWEKTYGGSNTDELSNIQCTPDGGYIFGGNTLSYNGDIKSGGKGFYDVWVVKIDSMGAIEWEKTYGGKSSDFLSNILLTSDGGYIFGGNTQSSDGDIKSGKKGLQNMWVVKIDSMGKIQWEKTYGGTYRGTYNECLSNIEHATDGSYIFGGFTQSSGGEIKSGYKGGLSDIWVVKIDSLGNTLWEKNYGGSGDDELSSIQLTSDGGYILGGETNSFDGDIKSGKKGVNSLCVLKIDSLGVIEWEKTYGGYSSEDFLSSIQLTSDGGYILGCSISNKGIKLGVKGYFDVWIVKIDSIGCVQWEKVYGGSHSDLLNIIRPTFDGGYIFGGKTGSSDGDIKSKNKGIADVWIVKIDSTGAIQWEETFGGSKNDELSSIQLTSDGGYIWGGETNSFNSEREENTDIWIVKMALSKRLCK